MSNPNQNLIGKTFGNWKVMKFHGVVSRKTSNKDKLLKRSRSSKTWLCNCSCGATMIYTTDRINQAIRKNQGFQCTHYENTIIGKCFGRLTATKVIDKGTKARIECTCSCSNKTVLTPGRFMSGEYKSCGCLYAYPRGITKVYAIDPKNIDITNRDKHRVISKLMTMAKGRRLSWNLSLPLAETLVISSCYYCGIKATDRKDGFNGIDRVDNSIGYEPNNVVPCCTNCNTAKMCLSQDEFKEMIINIYNNFCKS